MFTAQKSERAGFSLVELLTALAVAALILPAIVAVLPRAFDALVTASTTARAARATAAFDAAFDRDFASLVSACGFTGDGSSCSFWTMRPSSSGTFAPTLVEYRRGGSGIVRTEFPLSLYTGLVGTNAPSTTLPDTSGEGPSRQPATESFAVVISTFRYGKAEVPSDAPALPEWASPTNAPASVEFSFGKTGPTPVKRLYFRRTSP